MDDDLVLPDYGGPCITNIVPALLGAPDDPPEWLPQLAVDHRDGPHVDHHRAAAG